MLRTNFARRASAVSAAGTLAAALAWLPGGPASATPLTTQFMATASVNANTTTCPLTSAPGSNSANSPGALPTNGTHRQSVNISAQFTNSGDSTDTVQFAGHYSSTIVVKKRNGHLLKLLLTGTGRLDMVRSKGNATACDPSGLMAGITTFNFTQGKPGWFYISRSTVDKANLSIAALVNTDTNKAAFLEVFQGGKSSVSERAFVTHGNWGVEAAAGITAGNEALLLKSNPVNSVSMVFHPAGSALAGAQGSGKSFVKLPGSLSCSHHSATLTWSSSAGHVASGAFFVNGSKKAADSHPVAGRKIVLRHLSGTADNVVMAKLALKGGGTAQVTRSYIPCSA